MTNPEKIVNFEHYCKECIHYSKSESEDPCWQCLTIPVNNWSHKPVCFEEERSSK